MYHVYELSCLQHLLEIKYEVLKQPIKTSSKLRVQKVLNLQTTKELNYYSVLKHTPNPDTSLIN